MRPTLRPIFRIDRFADVPLSLPNSVAVTPEAEIVVVDGGNNRICVFDPDGREVEAIGRHGFGRYAFKEPVGIFAGPEGSIYVCDWHNHRLVVYSKRFRYVTEFGCYGRHTQRRRPERIALFAKSLAYEGSFTARYHIQPVTKRPGRHSMGAMIAGWRYWVERHGGRLAAIRAITADTETLIKPNGVAFLGGRLAVSDKHARSILWLEWSGSSLRQTDVWHGPRNGEAFGPLGNLATHPSGDLLVCDEQKHVIRRIRQDGRQVEEIEGAPSGVGEFTPFSCCVIEDSLLAVCGGLNLQILDLAHHRVDYCSEAIGELHSVAYDPVRQHLLVCNRSDNRIEAFKLHLTPHG